MSGTPPLRAGVIGLGWAGQQHMSAYATAEGVELVGLAGMEADALQQLGDTYAIAPGQRHADWQQLVASGELDLISIATPTTLHAPMAVAALDAGLHVLSEKPMAENGTAAATMVAAAARNDRVLDVSFNHRRRGDVAALKKIIDAGLLGDIYYAKAGWLRREGIPGLGSWFTRRATAGGGPLMDIGVHMLDMALHLMGEPSAEAVSAATYAEFGPRGRGGSVDRPTVAPGEDGTVPFEVEDLSTAFVRLSGGRTLLLEASWASYIKADELYVVLYGSEGGAVLGSPGTWSRSELSVLTEVRGVPAELFPVLPEDGRHREAVDDFVVKVQSPDWSAFHGEDALTRALVVDAAYRSAREHREVRLD